MFRIFACTNPRLLPGVKCCRSRTRNRSVLDLDQHAPLQSCRLNGAHMVRLEARRCSGAQTSRCYHGVTILRYALRPACVICAPGRNGSSAWRRSTGTAWAPPIDVYETERSLRDHRRSPGPGARADRARRRGQPPDDSRLAARRHSRESPAGTTTRSSAGTAASRAPSSSPIRSPSDGITADLRDGVLTVTLPEDAADAGPRSTSSRSP